TGTSADTSAAPWCATGTPSTTATAPSTPGSCTNCAWRTCCATSPTPPKPTPTTPGPPTSPTRCAASSTPTTAPAPPALPPSPRLPAVTAGLPALPRQPTGPQPPGRTLLELLHDGADDVLRFTHDTRIPPTNNQAERDLRPHKTQQKISGRLTSEPTTRHRLAIRSYLSTAAK